MNEDKLLERIVLNPQVMTGKPVIRGTRLTVEYLLNLLAHGATTATIREEYTGLEEADIQACLLFAVKTLGETTSRCRAYAPGKRNGLEQNRGHS